MKCCDQRIAAKIIVPRLAAPPSGNIFERESRRFGGNTYNQNRDKTGYSNE
jgi:hypothetical protein